MKAGLKTLFLSLICTALGAQSVQKIRFGKDASLIYFFQKGAASDTILKNKNDIFYLLVPDSLKPHMSILVDNGRIQATGNDSLVRIEFIKGLRYESVYALSEEEQSAGKKKKQPAARTLSTFINGTVPEGGRKNIMVISIVDRKEEKTVLGNVFYFKN